MINRYLYIIILLFVLWSPHVHSQADCITDPPVPPVLASVSVQPETGYTELKWKLSQSSGVAAYIVYEYIEDQGNRGDSITTIWNSAATSYTIYSTVSKYYSAAYVVAALRLPRCISIFSNVVNSIFTEAKLDTCNNRIEISWNSYLSSLIKVTDYSILVSVNGGSYSESGKVSKEHTSFAINDFTTDAEYCFVVRANLEDGTFSTSNKACIFTRMIRPPRYINADYANVSSDNKISLRFTIDPFSEIMNFRLERRTGQTSSFQEIAQPEAVNGSISFTDHQADATKVNYYRLSAINNCNVPVSFSNLCSNIVLSLKRIGDDLHLSWNPYREWMGTISSYQVFINKGNGPEEVAILQSNDTALVIGYKEIMYEINGDKICFYVSASETSNPYNINSQSISSELCTTPMEIVTVPNVFTPNSGTSNAFFKPVLSFTPVDYHLIISDRQGNILFETRDSNDEWDGVFKEKALPENVFLWFLKVTTPSGKKISNTGTLTIIHNRL